ncbi:hypothetical protein AQUCO_01000544v1, partial [Aquilegia coerulea]
KPTAKIPPGSLGLPLIGETLEFFAANNSNKGIYHFVQTRRLRYGNCFKTRILGEIHVFVSGTKSAKAVLGNDFGNFTKRYVRSMAELVGDQSLLCVSQQQHQLIRNQLSHLVSTESISNFIKHFDQMVVNTLTNWKHRDVVIVLQDALKITFNGMCKLLMSLEDSDELEKLQDDVAQICEAMLAFPLKLPGSRFYKGLKARRRVIDTLQRLMNTRRQGLEKYDFLQSLLEENKSPCHDAPMLTDTQIQENVLTLIIAGQVTTASAMTWMVKYLDENQEIQDTLRARFLTVLCIRQMFILQHQQQKLSFKIPPGSSLTLEDLNEMPYAYKVVKESLRLASIVAWFPRIALKDCEVEGFKIKKGWIVNIDARAIHLDPILYHDPTKFNPCRFDDELKPYSFLAFGTGARTCLGMNLAKAMITVFLHRLITTYRWKVIDSDTNLEKRALFARLKSGCPVSVMPLAPK